MPNFTPETLWSAWNWNPVIGFALLFSGWRYMDGVWWLWRQAGIGHGITRWHVLLFWMGIGIVATALISPIDALGEVSFAGHMGQHLLLMLVAPPLIILGAPPVVMAWSIPRRWRRPLTGWLLRQSTIRALFRFFSGVGVTWVLHVSVLILWHIPVLYTAAIEHAGVHLIEHASFFGAGLLYWYALLGTQQDGAGVLSLFATMIVGSILGALLTFSTTPWYPIHTNVTVHLGISPLEDQQIAGLLMWLPAGIAYTAAAGGLLAVWFERMEQRQNRQVSEQKRQP